MAAPVLSRCCVCLSRLEHKFLAPSRISITSTATLYKYYAPPEKFEKIEYPPGDLTRDNKLKGVLKVPQPPLNMKPPVLDRGMDLMRGPEETHNTLLHKQFGIVAMQGGRLKYGHFEMIRQTINRKLDTTRMFAVWRVDPPWHSMTKKSQGTRMGGGKGAINHYIAPVKAGRVLIEIGGGLRFEEMRRVMTDVANKLPFLAIATSYEEMEKKKKQDEEEHRLNLNPFSMEYIIKNNMGGCSKWLNPYDYLWHCKYQ